MAGRKVLVATLGFAAVLLLALGAYLKRDSLFDLRRPLPKASPPPPRVDILSGAIPLTEFYRFFQDQTGLTVIVRPPELARRVVDVPVNIESADAEIVRELLSAHGLEVLVISLPDGRRVLEISEQE